MGDVAGDIVPSRVDWIDLMARHAEAPGERRPGHQALYAVAMKGATARKAIARSARDADMADFRLHGAVHGMAVEREPTDHQGSAGGISQDVGWLIPHKIERRDRKKLIRTYKNQLMSHKTQQ